MIPSSVLVYIQMAEFLMLVMFISWLFSTFFFLPLCAAFGPINYIGQVTFRRSPKSKVPNNYSNHIELGTVGQPSQIDSSEIIYDEPQSNM